MKIKEKNSKKVVYTSLASLLVFFTLGGFVYKNTQSVKIPEAKTVLTVISEEETVNTNKIEDDELSLKVRRFLDTYYLEEKDEDNEKGVLNTYGEGKPYHLNSLGDFVLTGYCPCEECSEGFGHQTCTGAYATEGWTVAVDPNEIPYGSFLMIDGNMYHAEDCGGAINGRHIDIFKENHSDCFDEDCNGLHEVYLVVFEDAE